MEKFKEAGREVQKSVASVTLDVEIKGLRAVITPSDVTASQQRKIKLSGMLSQDLDNSNQRMQVLLYIGFESTAAILMAVFLSKPRLLPNSQNPFLSDTDSNC